MKQLLDRVHPSQSTIVGLVLFRVANAGHIRLPPSTFDRAPFSLLATAMSSVLRIARDRTCPT
jgi:hypothetical protein